MQDKMDKMDTKAMKAAEAKNMGKSAAGAKGKPFGKKGPNPFAKAIKG